MIKAIIIDDEQDAREALKLALARYCPEIEIAAVCDGPQPGLDAIKQIQPQVVFLDVQMPHMSGFDLLGQIEEVDFDVIFVTAYDRYAIKAIKFSALDYLLKPIDVDELQQAVNKLERNPEERGSAAERQFQYQSVVNNAKNQMEKVQRLAIPTLEGIIFLMTDDIIYCKADGNYTEIYLKDGQKILVSKKLKDFENMLSNSGFCRVHHAALVNLMHIQKYIKGDGGYVVLNDGHHVDVSRRKKEEFLSLIDKV